MKYILITVFILFFAGCTKDHDATRTLDSVIIEYQDAVIKNKPKKAYSLLEKDLKAVVSWNEFLEKWKKNRKEMLHQVKQLKSEAKVKLKIKNPDGSEIDMVTEKGNWKIENAPGLETRISTPAKLLAKFIDYIEKYDFQGFLSLLSPPYQMTIISELTKKIKMAEFAAKQVGSENTSSTEVLNIPLDKSNRNFVILRRYGKSWKIDGWKTLPAPSTIRRRR
ncbi:MAG: hypothetical protein JXR95_16620 [Deltaproteobacteria bacterium]|nr:hypothetical protein [Deltaproteobacteria bacterium]